jgi:hypothetical protein
MGILAFYWWDRLVVADGDLRREKQGLGVSSPGSTGVEGARYCWMGKFRFIFLTLLSVINQGGHKGAVWIG